MSLMISLLFGFRYDKFKKRVVSSGYFLCLTIGYGVGKFHSSNIAEALVSF